MFTVSKGVSHVDCRCKWDMHFMLLSFWGAFADLRKATASFVMPVRLETGRISVKFDLFFENLSKKFKFHSNLTRITGALREDLCTYMIVSRWISLKMRYVSGKSFRENRNTCLCSVTFFWKSCRLWGNVEKYGKSRRGYGWQCAFHAG